MTYWIMLFGVSPVIILLSTLLGVAYWKTTGGREYDHVEIWGGLAIGVFLAAFVFGVFASFSFTDAGTQHGSSRYVSSVQHYGLTALANVEQTQTTGSASGFLTFFLGEYTQGTVQKIAYINESPNGAHHILNIPVSEANIYLTSGTPHETVVHMETKPTSSWPWPVHSSDIEYNFYIPKGSIDSNYKVALGQ